MSISLKVDGRYPCRKKVLDTLVELVGYNDEVFAPAIYIYGQPGVGKTEIVKQFLYESVHSASTVKLRVAFINCMESYIPKILFENLITQINGPFNECSQKPAENINEFIEELRKLNTQRDLLNSYIIVLDNAEKLRDMDANVLPSMLRLQELAGINVCVVLISQIPYEKFYYKTGLTSVINIYFPQYTKAEILHILNCDFEITQKLLYRQLENPELNKNLVRKDRILDLFTQDFFNNYLNLYLSVFFKVCRDLTEIRITARKCFLVYMEPIINDGVSLNDVTRLWRNVAGPLRTALSQVYKRIALCNQNDVNDHIIQKLTQSLELPYFGKYLLIAAFLASYNSSKEDKYLFLKNHGKKRKKMQTVKVNAKPAEAVLCIGPKSFTVDRLLAIFYAILDEKVGLTCNLLSQLSTLVNLKLLYFASGDNLIDGSSRLQCTVSLDFVLCISQLVGFNIRQYLCISK